MSLRLGPGIGACISGVTQYQCELLIALIEDGKPADSDKRRFKIIIRPAVEGRKGRDEHIIDLDAVTDFCKGTRLNEQAQEKMVGVVFCHNWTVAEKDRSLPLKLLTSSSGRMLLSITSQLELRVVASSVLVCPYLHSHPARTTNFGRGARISA